MNIEFAKVLGFVQILSSDQTFSFCKIVLETFSAISTATNSLCLVFGFFFGGLFQKRSLVHLFRVYV